MCSVTDLILKKIAATKYFDLIQVKDNIFAAVKTNPLAMGNAGFIDLGDKVVVFDTFLSVEAADDLKKMITKLAGDKKLIIVNSHSHIDHYLGNCMFPEAAAIISSQETLSGIKKQDSTISDKDYFIEEKAKLKKYLENTTEEEKIIEAKNSLIICSNLSHPLSRTCCPDLTITKALKIHGEIDSLQLNVVGKAHTTGDIIAISKKEKVAFIGDLLFVGEHPFLGMGDPMRLKKELINLFKSDIEYFIPGHGPVSGKDKIVEEIEYIDTLIDLVGQHLDEPDRLGVEDLPDKFQNYSGILRVNINFLSQYLKEG